MSLRIVPAGSHNGFLHERSIRGATDDWITPKYLIDALGPFDLDPCGSLRQPYPCAARSYTILDNGLLLPWEGFVWCNPPYGPDVALWLDKLATHRGGGVALIFARTETKTFHRYVWGQAAAILFLRGRVAFVRPDGQAVANASAPSCLVAYGAVAVERLERSRLVGAMIRSVEVLDRTAEQGGLRL